MKVVPWIAIAPVGLAALFVTSACVNHENVQHGIDIPKTADTAPRHYGGLHQVVAYHDGFYSGGVPEGESGFQTLADMGVKTVISVDGAVPAVEAARKHGMRYIHLPIGYNGFDDKRRAELIKSVSTSINHGPVYLHCHHGKHRSASAAAAVAVALGWMSNQEAVTRMQVSGTSEHYSNLFACAASARLVSAAELDSYPAEFPEVSLPETFLESMVRMDEVMEHLKFIQDAQWRPSSQHPDLVPASEAGKLADILRFSMNTKRAQRKGGEFLDGLRENQQLAADLEAMIVNGDPVAELNAQFNRVEKSCKVCHEKFRDHAQ